jgi:hypothetical protein
LADDKGIYMSIRITNEDNMDLMARYQDKYFAENSQKEKSLFAEGTE